MIMPTNIPMRTKNNSTSGIYDLVENILRTNGIGSSPDFFIGQIEKITGNFYDDIESLYTLCFNGRLEGYEYIILSDALLPEIINNRVYTNMKMLGVQNPSFIEATLLLHNVGKLSNSYVNKVIAYGAEYIDSLITSCTRKISCIGYNMIFSKYAMWINESGQNVTLETIEYVFLRVAIHLTNNQEDAGNLYWKLISEEIIFGSPVIMNSGKEMSQLSSCFIINVEDSTSSILELLKETGMLLSLTGGVATSLSRIRATGSQIRTRGDSSSGIIPIIRTIDAYAAVFNCGRRRPTLSACYLEPWHTDIKQFIEMALPKEVCNKAFIGLWIPDEFFRCIRSGKPWYLFNPQKCPDLVDAFDEKFSYDWVEDPDESGYRFTSLYRKYTRMCMYDAVVDATDLFRTIISRIKLSGTPYLCAKDSANRLSNQRNLGTISSSNLCTEIMEYNDPDSTAVCNISSVILPNHMNKEGTGLDYDKLRESVSILVRTGDEVIDSTYYATARTRNGNLLARPLGIGLQGLADVFSMCGYPFDSDEAMDLSERISEHMYYYAVETTADMARKHGKLSINTPLANGIFHFEMIDYARHYIPPPKLTLNWEALRAEVIRSGIRNSLLIALMPTASTSVITGCSPCFEPNTGVIYKKKNVTGECIIINKYLARELYNNGLYRPDILNKIMLSNTGGISHVDEIPEAMRRKFKSAYEIEPKCLVEHAVKRLPFVDQSQSLNIFYTLDKKDPNSDRIIVETIGLAWKSGLKTLSYYNRINPIIPNQQLYQIDYPETCTNCDG